MSTAITKSQEKQANLKSLLQKALPSLQGIASQRLDPEKLMRIALGATSRNQTLLDCTPTSFLAALMAAASVGLEPETPLQHAYLVPRKNRHTGTMEATFLPSYKGLILLAVRSGDVAACWARIVYENEQFDVSYGLEETLEHQPIFEDDERGKVRAAYAVVKLKDGTLKFEVMTVKEIDDIRARSSAADTGPWTTDWEQMALKTVLKRVLKTVPTENEKLARAIEVDSEADRGGAPLADVLPLMAVNTDQAPSRAEALKRDLKRRKAEAQTTAPAPAPAGDEADDIRREEAEVARREQASLFEREPGSDDQ